MFLQEVNWQFIDLVVHSRGVVICGSNFNIILNRTLDSSGLTTQNRPLMTNVKTMMKELGIIDVWTNK